MDESQTSNLDFIRRDPTSPPAPNLNTAFHHRRREIRNLGFNFRAFKFSHSSRGLWVNPRKFVLQNLSFKRLMLYVKPSQGCALRGKI